MGDVGVPAGWYPDPMARHEYRYWDGTRWTGDVSDQGRQTLDPLADAMAQPVATPQTVAGPPPVWPVPAATAPRRRKKPALIALGLALVAIGGLVVVVAVAANTSSSKQYPKFCATAAKLDAFTGDAASVVKNAGPIAQVLAEIEKLPPSQVPVGAGTSAQSLRTQLAGWLFGTNYDPLTFQPVPSAVQRWQSTARELSSNVKSSCKSAAAKFFAAGPQTPTTTTPPRPVAGWASPGIRTLCVETNATFADAPLSRDQVLGAANLGGPSPFGLKQRKITLVAPGQPCDATLTIAFTGSALSSNYVGAGTLYTGATMSGTLTLSAPGQPNLVVPMNHREDTPRTTRESSGSLPKAPAEALHHTGLAAAVGAALDGWFGPA